METLFELAERRINQMRYDFERYLLKEINWEHRLIAIKGSRGVGKTTLLLQRIKNNYSIGSEALYASMDNVYFLNNKLIDLADKFEKSGGKYLFLDEVHKYPNWSLEIKNIYDNYPNLKLIISASSILDLNKGFADLSRRAITYNMNGLSLREFIELELKEHYQPFTIDDIIKNHSEISRHILEKIKPIAEFNKYIQYGYFPFYLEAKERYLDVLNQTINLVLESDLQTIVNIEYSSVIKLKKLLYAIASAEPFKPNISKLSERLGINRTNILTYLSYLERANILINLRKSNIGVSFLAKPEKIYINNSNYLNAIYDKRPEIGTIRETFFLNQMSHKNIVEYCEETDFIVNKKYLFEIGGQNKSSKQIANLPNSYIAADDIEIGFGKKIPLYLFGFTY